MTYGELVWQQWLHIKVASNKCLEWNIRNIRIRDATLNCCTPHTQVYSILGMLEIALVGQFLSMVYLLLHVDMTGAFKFPVFSRLLTWTGNIHRASDARSLCLLQVFKSGWCHHDSSSSFILPVFIFFSIYDLGWLAP